MNTEPGDKSLLMSMAGVQEKFQIGQTTLYALVKRGELTRVKIGRRSFITRKSVDDYFARLVGSAQ